MCSIFTTYSQVKEDINGNLIGPLQKNDFLKGKYKSWFTQNYNDYTPNEKILKKIKKKIRNVTVKSFIGTWCHDSERELPRFYKIMESIEFDVTKNFQMIGITRGKKTPNNLQKGYNIKQTPTFIFYKDNKEIGRYIEHSKKSIEKDILKILTK
ncbi:MAG: Uncharacterised protein [Flavobacterium sp. SCGC AAA160-P02]|nr:MAG: Uncharacterised protein [Flavobacterium sp. SCGC AAA160-P02]